MNIYCLLVVKSCVGPNCRKITIPQLFENSDDEMIRELLYHL
jgi:hypothetical protein